MPTFDIPNWTLKGTVKGELAEDVRAYLVTGEVHASYDRATDRTTLSIGLRSMNPARAVTRFLDRLSDVERLTGGTFKADDLITMDVVRLDEDDD